MNDGGGRGLKLGILTSRMRRGLGVDLTLHQIAGQLITRGWEVTVFTIEEDGEYAQSGYSIVGLDIPPKRLCLDHDKAAKLKADRLNEYAPDAWLVSAPPFYALAPFLDAPVVHLDHGISPSYGLSWKRRVNWKLMWLSQFFFYHKHAAMLTTPSEFIRGQFTPDVRNKTYVTHWGSDHYTPPPDLVDRSAGLREELGVGDNDVLMLYVGRLNPVYQRYKGVSELEDHFASVNIPLPGTRMLMVGLGEDSDRERLKAKGIDCMILPPAEMMPEIYSACDLFVTCTRWEGFDLPLMEAQAFGKPVLAYRIGAHPEVARDRETGYIVNTPKGFQARMRKLVRERDTREQFGENARQWAATFTWGKVGERYHELIGSVVR